MNNERDIIGELKSINKNILDLAHYIKNNKRKREPEHDQEQDQEQDQDHTDTKNRNIGNPNCAGRVFEDPPVPCLGGKYSDVIQKMLFNRKKIEVCKSCKLAKQRHGRAIKKQKEQESSLEPQPTLNPE